MRIGKFLNRKAVYWAPAPPNRYGHQTYAPAVEIRCRWDASSESFVDPSGDTKLSSAKVMVEDELELDGILWKGTIPDAKDLTNPMANDGAFAIKKIEEVDEPRRAKVLYRMVYL
jgi:hypothetical protein